MGRQRLIPEELRQPVVRLGKASQAVELPFGFQNRFPQLAHVVADPVQPGHRVQVVDAAIGAQRPGRLVLNWRAEDLALLIRVEVGTANDAARHAGMGRVPLPSAAGGEAA